MRGQYDTSAESIVDLAGLGKSLKNARLDNNLTQDAIAKAIGIKRRSYIADIEAGRYMPSIATLAKMSLIINYDLNTIKEFIIKDIIPPEPNRRVFMKKYNKDKTN